MFISAIVCTYNRGELLQLALDSLFAQSLPSSEYEVILVNDGSTDGTRDIAAAFSNRHGNFRYIEQANQGLSGARNVGFNAATAPLVAYLDDDARAAPHWLETMVRAAERLPVKVACFGGPIELDWEVPRPAWLDDQNLTWLGFFDCGGKEEINNREGLFRGGNMAIRRDLLVQLGGFSTDLGRNSTTLLSHEESALWERTRDRGLASAYLPEARIWHWVPRERLRRGYFRRRVFWEGVSVARRQCQANPAHAPVRRWLKAANYLRVKLLARESLRTAIRPWRWHSELPWQCYLSYHWGVVVEMLRATPAK